MKKSVSLLLAALITALALGGCGRDAQQSPFTASNEILTYERIDEKKTTLVASMIGNNANVKQFSKAFEEQNPDVQVVCLDITGGDSAYKPVVEWVTHGLAPDVMFLNADSFVDDEITKQYFENLSANPVVESFEAEALNRVAVDGHVYFLPAPSEVNCMLYNKTLFEKYGWDVPTTFDEFVALCLRIREDTDGAVQPWNPNAKYDSIFTVATEAFTYAELFGGLENRAWYNDFCAGEAAFAGHMEPYYDMLQTLIDNELLLEEHFTYSATTRGKEFVAGQIAMLNAPVSVFSGEYEFGLMPYPTTVGEIGYVNDSFSALVGVPKKERTEAETDAVNRYIAFFGSPEGQQALIGASLMISNVKDVPLSQTLPLSGIESVLLQGHKFSRLDFTGPGELNWTFSENALSMVTGEKTGAQCIADIDAKPYKAHDESASESAKPLATVTEDFTILEFSGYIADMYREKAGADIGLINHGVAYRGNLVRLFKGELYDSYVTILKPRSFANNSTLVKVSMTGGQLLEALNHPAGNNVVSDSIYAFSGLKCEVTPLNELGQKYLSVKLADGSAVEPDRLYTVAIWDGTVSEEYITEVLATYEGTFEDLLTAKLTADGTLAPAKDGRIKLNWN